jgi:hypothetical protein
VRKCGSTARSTRSVPKTLVSNGSRAASIGTSSTLPKMPMPALHTSASSRGVHASTCATPLATDASSRTSSAMKRTPGRL